MSPPQLHHYQFMLTQVRISHRILAEQKKELRNSQLNKNILEVFILHYHTKDLVNRESVSKPADVATTISRKYGCAIAADDDVARAYETDVLPPGSYFPVPTTRFLLPVH